MAHQDTGSTEPRKPYVEPKLVTHGNVEALTEHGGSKPGHGGDDAGSNLPFHK